MRPKTSVIGASAALLSAAALLVNLGSASAASTGRAVLAGSAAPARARTQAVGAVKATAPISFRLLLKLRDPGGAQALVRAVSDPTSPSYRHYLTAAQWEARFSPTAAQVAQATAWLRSRGFTVGAISKDRLTISASGTAAQVEAAFATGLANYRIAGHTLRKATGNLSVPASVAGVVQGALGINQTVATPAAANPDLPASRARAAAAGPGEFPPPPAAYTIGPDCGSYYGAVSTLLNPPFGQGYPNPVPNVVCGYRPGQLRSAYGVGAAATGKGATVAIIDAYDSATIAADATKYFNTNDPSHPFSSAAFSQIDAMPFDQQTLCSASDWLTEQALDVEAVHSTAPDAHIVYVGAQDCANGLFTAEQAVIDNHLADVVTNSWGDTGGDLFDDAATKTAYDDLFMLADTTGMTIQFSSGDAGDNFTALGVSVADYPTESPFVTSVGGTSLKVGFFGERDGELGWDTGRAWLCTTNLVGVQPGCTSSTAGHWLPASPDGSSGGFTSYYYTQPYYQAPVVPTSLSERNSPIFGPVPARVEPDISADADPGTGFLEGLTETFPNGTTAYGQFREGGTSLASPLLAGIVADADSIAPAPVGFVNPILYKLDQTAPYTIDDIGPTGLQGNFRVDIAGQPNVFPTARGLVYSFRELYYSGLETYCDATNNCASRPETQSAVKGYDSLTGLGSPGLFFINALAR